MLLHMMSNGAQKESLVLHWCQKYPVVCAQQKEQHKCFAWFCDFVFIENRTFSAF